MLQRLHCYQLPGALNPMLVNCCPENGNAERWFGFCGLQAFVSTMVVYKKANMQ